MKFKILIALTLIFLFGYSLYYFANYIRVKDNVSDNVEDLFINEEPTNNYSKREINVFEKDKGYLVKGKLLDVTFKEQYDKIPDTLAIIEFGDKLYSSQNDIQEIVSKPCFSLYPVKKTTAKVIAISEDYKFDNLKKILKLCDSGKVEYPTESSGGFINQEQYDEKYGSEFPSYYQKSIPYEIKQVLVKYFKDNNNSNYTLTKSDQRDIRTLFQSGFFTQKKRREYGIILRSKDTNEPNSPEKLLVIAYNNQQEAYLLFSKTFYNKIVIETLARENESDILSIYMNSEDYEESEFEVLIVTSKNKPDIALVYDQKFDEMTEYIQKPKSEIEDSESEE